jgi:hypothetical protein
MKKYQKIVSIMIIGIFVALLICLSGCIYVNPYYTKPNISVLSKFQQELNQRKENIPINKWTDNTVDEITEWALSYTHYIVENESEQQYPKDNPYDLLYWDILNPDHIVTPKEFVLAKHFYGDCDDFAVFLWAVFEYLGYPHEMRIEIFWGHALLYMWTPWNSKWKIIETVPSRGLEKIDRLFYQLIYWFNDKEMYFPNPKNWATSMPGAIRAWQDRIEYEGLF